MHFIGIPIGSKLLQWWLWLFYEGQPYLSLEWHTLSPHLPQLDCSRWTERELESYWWGPPALRTLFQYSTPPCWQMWALLTLAVAEDLQRPKNVCSIIIIWGPLSLAVHGNYYGKDIGLRLLYISLWGLSIDKQLHNSLEFSNSSWASAFHSDHHTTIGGQLPSTRAEAQTRNILKRHMYTNSIL